MAPSIALAVIILSSLMFLTLPTRIVSANSENVGVDDTLPLDVFVRWIVKNGETVSVVKRTKPTLSIFCRRGDTKKLSRIWRHAAFKINIKGEDFKLFLGANQSDVYHKYEASELTYFNLKKLMPWKTDTASLEPFQTCCLGVFTNEPYNVTLTIKAGHSLYLLISLIGIGLFFGADDLSRNIIFYYGSGVSLGVLASLLIVIFIASRYFPKKYGGYAFLVGGWSFVLYILQHLWTNLQRVLESYTQYIMGYFTVVSLLSFAYCYYRGPVQNPRTLRLIKWTIQLVGLMLIYNSSQIQEVSIFSVTLTLAIYNFPRFIINGVFNSWYRMFPPKVKLLSEQEFLLQGTEETRKALEDLREYCRSPQCDAWKVIGKIKTPQRFAQFVEGSPHVTDSELLDYESDSEFPVQPDFTDDDSDIDFRLSTE